MKRENKKHRLLRSVPSESSSNGEDGGNVLEAPVLLSEVRGDVVRACSEPGDDAIEEDGYTGASASGVGTSITIISPVKFGIYFVVDAIS